MEARAVASDVHEEIARHVAFAISDERKDVLTMSSS